MNVQFSVRGRTFNVRTEDDGDVLKRLAKALDEKMTAQAAVARKLDEPSLAVITALDMLHEAALEKQRLVDEVEIVQKKLDMALSMLDALLAQSNASDAKG